MVFRIIPVPFTPLMVQRLIEHRDTTYTEKKTWVPIEQMGLNIPHSVVTSEDPKFFNHFGFDFDQIYDAVNDNLEEGKRLRGASTISQQTAKNLFLLPVRSFIRKGVEVYFTLLLETCWTKKRILEVYLNIIETGNGLFGMEASAQKYFRKSCKQVSANEAALMVAVLPNPIRWTPSKPTPLIIKKKNIILSLKRYIPKSSFYWVK
jgi:monofunctional biosynthetic peptidoglycan transglycosylase